MTQTDKIAAMALTLAPLALCQGCAGDPAYRVPTTLSSNVDIEVVRAEARRKPGGIDVRGDVRRPNGFAGIVPGHLHVIGRDLSGNALATTDASWGEFMNRRFRLAYFKAFLHTSNPAAVVTISVEPVTRERP